MRTVLYFSSPTCGYCKPIKIIIEDLKADYEDNENIRFKSVVVDPAAPQSITFAKQWGISGVPTIIFANDGKEYHRLVGKINRELIVDGIERNL